MIIDRPKEVKKVNCYSTGHPVDKNLFIHSIAIAGEWYYQLYSGKFGVATGVMPSEHVIYICDECGSGFVSDYGKYIRRETRKERKKRTKKGTTCGGPN